MVRTAPRCSGAPGSGGKWVAEKGLRNLPGERRHQKNSRRGGPQPWDGLGRSRVLSSQPGVCGGGGRQGRAPGLQSSCCPRNRTGLPASFLLPLLREKQQVPGSSPPLSSAVCYPLGVPPPLLPTSGVMTWIYFFFFIVLICKMGWQHAPSHLHPIGLEGGSEEIIIKGLVKTKL